MAKKIKSFTVDEDVYNRLVAMFKKHKAETSISMYLNNQLRYLLEYLESLEEGFKDMDSSMPMSFVIDNTVRCSERSGRLSKQRDKDFPESDLGRVMQEFLNDYEADKKGIPRELYPWLGSEMFSLSNDKKFLILNKTGEKFIPNNQGQLMGVRELDTKELSKMKKK